MAIHNRAGQPAQQSDLINVAQLTAQYYVLKPEPGECGARGEIRYFRSPWQCSAPQL